jgi:hypothetical protein
MASELSSFSKVPFVPIEGARPQRRQQCFFFVIDALLRSRQAAGIETGSRRPDEDVNMYLTELLCRYAVFPVRDQEAELYPFETDLIERLREEDEPRARYSLYRFQADHLLVTLGVFGNAWWRRPRQSAFCWTPTREESINRGKWYYGRAALYASRLEESRRGVDDLMSKLELGFEDYIVILETLRGEYFNLVKGFSPGEWYHLCRDLGVAPD